MTYKLERVYLMNVSLYFTTYFDVLSFIQINKKCFSTINDLKVNPWLTTPFSIIKFVYHFNPETVNCCSFQLNKPRIFDTCTFIRNPNFLLISENQQKKLIPLFNKITTLTFYKTKEEQSMCYIKNASKFTSLKSIFGDIELIVQFIENSFKDQSTNLRCLNKIQIEPQSNQYIFPYKTLPLLRKLRNIIGINNRIKVILISFYSAFNRQEVKEFEKINVQLFYKMLTQHQLDQIQLNYTAPRKVLAIEGTYNCDKFNKIIDKRQPTVCVVLMENNPLLKEEIERSRGSLLIPEDTTTSCWTIPKCIKELQLLKVNPVVVQNTMNIVPLYPADCFYLKVIKLEQCRNIFLQQKLPNLKTLIISECDNVTVQTIDETYHFGLTNIKKLMILRSNDIHVQCNSNKFKELIVEGGERIYIYGTIDSVRDFTFLRVIKIVLPSCSFYNKYVNIQYCSSIKFVSGMNIRSPIEFLGINVVLFNKLIQKILILPLSLPKELFNEDTFSNFFYMAPFFLNSERIKKHGNTLSMKKRTFSEIDCIDVLISTQFLLAGKSDKLVTILNENEFSIFDASIRYFEVTITGSAVISVGLIDVIRIHNEEYTSSNRLVGLDVGSIGYYSENGFLFNESKITKYSEPYAICSSSNDTIGCGYNTKTKEVFFTKNRIKLPSIPFKCHSLSAVISIDFMNKMTINYGNTPFKFNIKKELENNGLINQFKTNCQIV
ncbi:hypothetical protein EDI_113340 [Entamoeba dispar SAW760]|uniref:B30.2/SPRY domain-containing protein n=1 Tax=Entamoeba dispar (strain ATCC PRA-260 / SAW760) TaxID=370354 RepID=B0E5Y1_ENTDS|nr:uncharacterized protein EDI_113340 [Entamoeba dispar SAW760]EDR30099.1 hypothetical protein EDI_113340 [Entamoeba dispar SAW760]|eukprot:EDR30099.1 hypothetical protein EDI_113340 [Entamoeba dispar SAW760]